MVTLNSLVQSTGHAYETSINWSNIQTPLLSEESYFRLVNVKGHKLMLNNYIDPKVTFLHLRMYFGIAEY